MAGSKFRAASVETLSDVYDFIQKKFSDEHDYVPRRRRRQTRSDVRLSSIHGQELNGIHNSEINRRSGSIPAICIYPLNHSSKRLSSETVISSQLNSRQPSKGALYVAEV